MLSKITAVAIFAGGESRRMGQDKALLSLGRETLLEHTARATSGVGGELYIVGREKPANWNYFRGEFLPDDEPNLGPIGALRTILRREQTVMVFACDLPRLTHDATLWLRDKADKQLGKHGLIVVNAGQREPLFSIYTAECLPLVEENIKAGRRSLHALIERGEFTFVEAPPEITSQLTNVNTPEDWAALMSARDC